MLDKAQSLARTSSDPKVTTRISQVQDRYKSLCQVAKERVEKYEEYVRDHQQYNTAATETTDWLSMMKERLEMCGDSTGDRHAVQNRLDRLEVSCICN
jgi:nesprin-1